MGTYHVVVHKSDGTGKWEGDVDGQTAVQIIALIEEASAPSGEAAGSRIPEPELPEVAQWMERARPRNNMERFAVLAAYVEDEEDRPLRWSEIRRWLEKTRTKPPANLGRDLRKALDEGLIEPVGPHPDDLEDVRDAKFRATSRGREVTGTAA